MPWRTILQHGYSQTITSQRLHTHNVLVYVYVAVCMIGQKKREGQRGQMPISFFFSGVPDTRSQYNIIIKPREF